MPVETEDAAERLEPEWIGQLCEDCRRRPVLSHGEHHGAGQTHHPPKEPSRSSTPVERKIGRACPLHHLDITDAYAPLPVDTV